VSNYIWWCDWTIALSLPSPFRIRRHFWQIQTTYNLERKEYVCTVDHGEFKVWLITGESTQSTRYIHTYMPNNPRRNTYGTLPPAVWRRPYSTS
jgi:hypothetical protein